MAMRPLKALMKLGEAMELLMAKGMPIDRVEQVPSTDAIHRVLAADVVARFDVPSFPRAAMDGYAVRAEDTFGAGQYSPKELELIEEVHAGDVGTLAVRPATCVQVATGAPIPEGSDAVVQVEVTDREGQHVRVYKPVYPKQNVSSRGADFTAGSLMLKQGTHLTPSTIGVLAALGYAEVEVYERPTVAIIPTGNEVVPPGHPVRPGQIYDINSYTLCALCKENGWQVRLLPVVPDRREALTETILQASAADLVVLSGGSSVGERDQVIDVISELGSVEFHGIAVKPGKPTLLGVLRVGTVIIGMPGYPTSCLTNGYGLLAPLLRKIARLPEKSYQVVRAPMARRMTSELGRHQYLTVAIEDGQVVPVFKESGTITSMANAMGYIEIPENVDLVEKGEMVDVVLF
ncbi:MAG: molybdenum cofactor biosynthesis protein [Deltaproteobacteria bacterium]|nr:molybdenum cofactor biosynthesis protein [Deltaproteobacteria bacterium]